MVSFWFFFPLQLYSTIFFLQKYQITHFIQLSPLEYKSQNKKKIKKPSRTHFLLPSNQLQEIRKYLYTSSLPILGAFYSIAALPTVFTLYIPVETVINVIVFDYSCFQFEFEGLFGKIIISLIIYFSSLQTRETVCKENLSESWRYLIVR